MTERDAAAALERLADAESDGDGDREALGRLLIEALGDRDITPETRLETLRDGETEGTRDANDDGDADIDARRDAVKDAEPLLVGLAARLRLETCDALPLLKALSPLPIGEVERIALPLRINVDDLRPELVRLAEADDDCDAATVTESDIFAVHVGGTDLDASTDLVERAEANAVSVDANEDDASAAEALAQPLFISDADAIKDSVDRRVAAPVEYGEVEWDKEAERDGTELFDKAAEELRAGDVDGDDDTSNEADPIDAEILGVAVSHSLPEKDEKAVSEVTGGIDSRAEADGDGCDDVVSVSVACEEKVFDFVAIDTSADDVIDCTLDAVVNGETLGDAEVRAERESVGDADELEVSLELGLVDLDESAEVDDVGDANAERDSAGDFESDDDTDGDGEEDDDAVTTPVNLEETLELTEPVGEAVRRTVLDGIGERVDEADMDGDADEDDVFNEALALGDPLVAAVLRAVEVPVVTKDPVLSLEDVGFRDSDAVIDRVVLGEEEADTESDTVGDGLSELDTDELLI